VGQSHAALNERIAGTLATQVDSVGERLDSAALSISATAQATAGHFAQQSAALLQALDQAHTRLQSQQAARDEQRLAGWTEALTAMAAALQREWAQAGAQTAAQQAQICQTLEQTASRISSQAEAHARSTITEIARLVQTASEAPRAAADVVAQLRGTLSDSLARDTAMLEERSRIMATLNSLLDAVQHTSTGQKAAIDQLVSSTAAWLDQAGSRFGQKVDAESARMESVAAQLTGSAVEVASLGEAFGAAVDGFSQSSDKLMAHLQRIDETLGRSIARSDEQLAYYVAQARELIDLSLMSQKQIVDDLQRVAGGRALHSSEA
jgi:ABC-type transporter Mla subunit MlaD